ncbi:MAG: hypothetical protein KJP20_07595 [Bacteroidia bacterium]|nr:hypothetical protein [Bacteroidia bacterium]
MKYRLSIVLFLMCFFALAQEQSSNYRSKKVSVRDTIVIDSVSINPSRFIVKDKFGELIDSTLYIIDYSKAVLTFNRTVTNDSIIIEYLRYPEFLTKTYNQLDRSIIVEDTKDLDKLYKLSQPSESTSFTPFDGLSTSGSISRGVTIGNNQNSVLNSELDLQITGKLNDKVSLRASIQDANIPLQESGYSQRLDEFDQVFIELFSDKWKIRAGDIDLTNKGSYYANFSKRVQGLSVAVNLDHPESKTQMTASGALVRGQFATSQFRAQEGNQGPYKLQGPNGELFVLIVSGSEMVYVNGLLLERGENKDYIIDYNAGEIIFNSTFPVTSEMRITVDYQFSDRNYSRLVAFGGANYETEKLKLGVSVYNENDAKNQPLQQNLSEEQVQILADAGDDNSLMIAPSAIPEPFNENRVLYRKEIINNEEVFVFSSDPDDELFSVKFTLVGDNQGDYIVSNTSGLSTIFEYIAPINGVPQGRYAPIIQLIAPTKLQIAVFNGTYQPSEKTNIGFELAASKNDLNLFSDKDDSNNDGVAAKFSVNQFLKKSDSLWNINAIFDGDYIDDNFRTIERLYRPEFIRDWNIDQPTSSQNINGLGNQIFATSGIELMHPKKGIASYQFEHLNFANNFNGNRHVLAASLKMNRFNIFSNSSYLTANSTSNKSTFLRSFNRFVYRYNKGWIGSKIALEDNEQVDRSTNELSELSQKFATYELFTGIGDSTKLFVEIGYKFRINDSIRNNQLERVNASNTYFVKSKIIQNKNSNLGLFVNYRTLSYEDETIEDEQSLNSRLQYSQKFIQQLMQWNTVFETNSGTLPQQEFTYIEVEPGQGAYTWIDYNNNGIQELEEFEIAQFQDQGSYIRVLLPNQIFLKTHQNRLSQTLTINPQQWANVNAKPASVWTKFYNQTAYLIDRKVRRNGNNFNLNPFENTTADQLGLQLNFRNSLFFNRGKQHYTTSYTFLSNESRSVLSVGYIENKLKSHQFDFTHLLYKSWLVKLFSAFDQNESESENFPTKNFKIDEVRLNPKLSYLLNDAIRFDVFYQFSSKDNTIGDMETLRQQKYGLSFAVSNNQKAAISGEFNFFSNDFSGNANSPVGYQMMEGLQPGKNFTWNLIAQKKLTKFLDLNLNYFGRKSETSKAIHTGSIQLKAYF